MKETQMKLLVLSAVIGATLFAALPASAEIVVRAGENGVAVRDRDSYRTMIGAVITPSAVPLRSASLCATAV
jgi:hypothetical protein